ncbi:N-acetylornithine carbamoyltransferase [Candidatus Peregrinibacteria bacterium]|nr:N-acetylornithine carbamoyltransferase [Candidatus Peregrinibacteria bacterium]
MIKHFLDTGDYSKTALEAILRKAVAYKTGKIHPDHAGKIITLLFANPSLRTRLSFESGMKKMGGYVNVISGNDTWDFEYQEGSVMNGATQEHIKEAARVISQYTDLIALRKSELMTKGVAVGQDASWEELRKDIPLRALAKYAEKPVINMESNMAHPCQAMADVMTIQEKLGSLAGKKVVLTWAPHPKPLPLATPHSQFLTPAILGMNVTLACPDGFDLDEKVIELAKRKAREAGGSVTITHDQQKAFEDADVVIAKSWASLAYFGKWDEEAAHRKKFENWIVTEEKMAKTNHALFMHCLPVRRNVVVSDGVLDAPYSVIIQEAENRMWSQMAIMDTLLTSQ